MEKQPLVSVLIPVYNTALYLKECLDSVLAQTLQDIEIICVNDGATDNSLEILIEYQKNDNRIKIVDKQNGGLPSARNAGLEIAKGEYVGFVDSDDYVSTQMYETMYQAALKNKSEVVICGAEIFPLDPYPSDWLFDVLSPNDITYKNCTKKLLFEEKGVKPFIWRYLIKRSLIENYHLRLQEDIIIGEDQAFQFKVLPKAKGVTLISNKLYYYRWYREDSITNSTVYADYNKKTIAHAKMIESITNELQESGYINDTLAEYMNWCLPFIYDDFIKLPLDLKISLSKKLTRSWANAGFNYSSTEILPVNRDMAKYIYSFLNITAIMPKISIIVPINNSRNYIEDCINSICKLSIEEIEIILINNGTNDGTYDVIYKYLNKDKRVRVFNQAWKPLSDMYNLGINLASAKYLTFIKPLDYYYDNKVIENIVFQLDNNQLAVGGYCNNLSEGVYSVDSCQNLHYYMFVYNREMIIKNKILFEDYSFLTGTLFFTQFLTTQEKVFLTNKEFYCKNKTYKRSSIYTAEANLILSGYLKLVEYSQKYSLTKLNKKIAIALNSENYVNLIINSTLPYEMPNEKGTLENSQAKTLELLLSINMLINSNKDNISNKSLLKVLYIFINERQKYLATRG